MDGDVDEDDHRGDGSPGGTPAPLRERGGESPPCASSSMASPLDGERFSLWSLASMVPGGARAPTRLDLSLSLFSSVSTSLFLAENHFFYIRRSVTPIGLKF